MCAAGREPSRAREGKRRSSERGPRAVATLDVADGQALGSSKERARRRMVVVTQLRQRRPLRLEARMVRIHECLEMEVLHVSLLLAPTVGAQMVDQNVNRLLPLSRVVVVDLDAFPCVEVRIRQEGLGDGNKTTSP